MQAIIDTRDYETGRYLVMVTNQGVAKKTEFKEYDSRNQTLVAIKLVDGDELVIGADHQRRERRADLHQQGHGDPLQRGRPPRMGWHPGVRGIRLRHGDQVVAAV